MDICLREPILITIVTENELVIMVVQYLFDLANVFVLVRA